MDISSHLDPAAKSQRAPSPEVKSGQAYVPKPGGVGFSLSGEVPPPANLPGSAQVPDPVLNAEQDQSAHPADAPETEVAELAQHDLPEPAAVAVAAPLLVAETSPGAHAAQGAPNKPTAPFAAPEKTASDHPQSADAPKLGASLENSPNSRTPEAPAPTTTSSPQTLPEESLAHLAAHRAALIRGQASQPTKPGPEITEPKGDLSWPKVPAPIGADKSAPIPDATTPQAFAQTRPSAQTNAPQAANAGATAGIPGGLTAKETLPQFLLSWTEPGVNLAPVRMAMPVASTSSDLQRAQNVATQLAGSIRYAASDKVELRLDPPELGRVLIQISIYDGELRAIVTAERAETAELMRRNADILGREMARAGLAGADLSFQSEADQRRAAHPSNAPQGISNANTQPNDPANLSAVAVVIADDGRLDIRL